MDFGEMNHFLDKGTGIDKNGKLRVGPALKIDTNTLKNLKKITRKDTDEQ